MQRTIPELPGAWSQDLNQRLANGPSAPQPWTMQMDFLELTISAHCILL